MNHATAPASLAAPTILATSARHRILAWPRYERAIDLDTLARVFGPALGERDDVCLCLRHDPAIDIPLPAALAAVSTALTRGFGPDPRFEVLMVDNPLDVDGWSSLAQAITGVVLLPWSWDVQRHGPLGALGHPLLTSGEELLHHLAGVAPALTPGAAAARPIALAAATPAGASDPAISILLRAFNGPAALRGALDSLVNQTFRDFEVVIVNDGSASLESLLFPYHAQLAITYLRRSAAQADLPEPALKIARGQRIVYLDDTDRCPPDHLTTLVFAQKGRGPKT